MIERAVRRTPTQRPTAGRSLVWQRVEDQKERIACVDGGAEGGLQVHQANVRPMSSGGLARIMFCCASGGDGAA